MNAYSRYAQTQKQTASPERLMVMLFDAAVGHLRAAAAAFDSHDGAAAVKRAGKAADIVASLQGSLRHDVAPELCQRLSEVYDFVLQRITAGLCQREGVPLREAERALLPIASGFSEAVTARAAP